MCEERIKPLPNHLVWNDGPIAGVAQCVECARLFAFQCHYHIWRDWIEWRLVPIAVANESGSEYSYNVEALEARQWLSVDDDQRPGKGRCVALWVSSEQRSIDWYDWDKEAP
jgi:hypothetical protein